jgi:non-canonical (house-cleaning) NTP pyrophosphatase
MLRAHRSAERYGDGYHVGIQSGIVWHEIDKQIQWMDQACVFLFVKDGLNTQSSIAWSASVSVPVGMAERVKNGFNELGAIVEHYSKRQDKDAVAFFSRHCARRRDFIADAVLSAFGSLSFMQNLSGLPAGPFLQLVKS